MFNFFIVLFTVMFTVFTIYSLFLDMLSMLVSTVRVKKIVVFHVVYGIILIAAYGVSSNFMMSINGIYKYYIIPICAIGCFAVYKLNKFSFIVLKKAIGIK